MKRIILSFLCLTIIFCLCACGGNVKAVTIVPVESVLYSEDEINSAIQVVINEFKRDWKGCTLTEISYAGDERTSAEYDYYADTYNTDELIVLTSSFDVDASGGDGSLNPNSTYSGWSWVLVRDNGGKWRHLDHGYG